MQYARPEDLQVEIDDAKAELAKAQSKVRELTQYIEGLTVAESIFQSVMKKRP